MKQALTYSFSTKTTRILLAIAVFIIVLLILGLPYRSIGFEDDSFGNVFSCLYESRPFFREGINIYHESLNGEKLSFSCSSFYRPLQYVMFYICASLFKTSAYEYFLVSIVFHAFVSAVMFYAFSLLCDFLIAWLLALLFAFFPAHYPAFLGLIHAIIPFHVFTACSLLFFIFYRKNRIFYWYLLSAFFYFLALFSYELPMVLPFILFLYFILFNRSYAIRDTWIFFGAIGLHFILRFLLLGNQQTSHSGFTLIGNTTLKVIIGNWYQAAKPFWGMQEMPKAFVAGLICLIIAVILFYIVFNVQHRKKMIFYIVAFFMASWPVFFCGGWGWGRYFYMAIPFFLLIFIELVSFIAQRLPFKIQRSFVVGLLLLGISWGVYQASSNLRMVEECTARRDKAFQMLAHRYAGQKGIKFIFLGTLCFFRGQTALMKSSMTQALRIFFNSPSLLVYHASTISMYCKMQPEKSFTIIPIRGGYRFISEDPERLFIISMHEWQENDKIQQSMGTLEIHKKTNDWQISDASFTFDKKWFNDIENTIFLTWDPVLWTFVELNKDHLMPRSK